MRLEAQSSVAAVAARLFCGGKWTDSGQCGNSVQHELVQYMEKEGAIHFTAQSSACVCNTDIVTTWLLQRLFISKV